VLGTPRIITMPSAGVVRATGAGSLGIGGGPIAPVAPRGGWVDRVPNQRGKDLAPYIQGVADRYGLDPALLAAVFWTESAYQADAVSSAGAVGLGQLMPGTAQTLGVDPRDPMQNMDGSARLYRYLIDKYGGSLELAISAYACGEGAVARAGGVPSDFARSYITKLLGRRDYLAGVRPTPP
jgi:soluble lytic murein transglycosylase-like protein